MSDTPATGGHMYTSEKVQIITPIPKWKEDTVAIIVEEVFWSNKWPTKINSLRMNWNDE